MLFAPRAIASSHGVLSFGAVCIYSTGSFICHQRPERSFFLFGRQLPVCARCTGLYAGAALGAPLALLLATSAASSRARVLFVAAALPTATTWVVEYAGFAHVSNAIRFTAALPLGFTAAWLVLGVFAEGRGRRRDGMMP